VEETTMGLSLTRERVRELAREYALIPLCLDVIADLETPVTAYLKLARGPYSFLLESVEGGARLARYSFIGTEPRTVLRFQGGHGERLTGTGELVGEVGADPLPLLKADVLDARAYVDPALPPLVGGAVGYLGYEVVRQWEPRVPPTPGETVDMPDGVLMLTDTVLAFDHFAHRIRIVTHVRPDDYGDVDQAYDAAVARVYELASRLRDPLSSDAAAPPRHPAAPVNSNFARAEYEACAERCRQYIMAGDAIQIVLAQRFARPTEARPFDI